MPSSLATTTKPAAISGAAGKDPKLRGAFAAALPLGDNWPLHEYAKVDKADLDRFGSQVAAWKH